MKNHDHSHDIQVKSVDKLSPTRVKVSIEFPFATFQEHEESTAFHLMRTAKIPGFRPGKAPITLVKQKYRDEIRKEVVSHLVEAGISGAIEKEKLSPINYPKIELNNQDLLEGKVFSFSAEFEVRPEIDLKDYKKLKIKKFSVDVTEKDVNDVIDNLRERYAVLEPVETTKAKKGLVAEGEIGFHLKDNPEIKQDPHPFTVQLGEGNFLEDVEKALLEMSVGETREVEASIPADHNNPDFAGKLGLFKLKLNELKNKKLPEVNDDFAGQVKPGATLEAFKKDITDAVREGKEKNKDKTYRDEVLESLLKAHNFEVPASLLNRQAYHLIQSSYEDMKARGIPFPELKKEDVDVIQNRAERMVRGSLLLGEIASKEKISVDEDRLEAKVGDISKQLGRSVDETRKFLDGKGVMSRLRDEVLTDQVFEFLINHAELE